MHVLVWPTLSALVLAFFLVDYPVNFVGHVFIDDPAAAENLFEAHERFQVLAQGFQWSEGPVWLDEGYLLFSDVKRNVIYKYNGHFVQPFSRNVGCYAGNARCGKLYEPGTNGLVRYKNTNFLVVCQHGERSVSLLNLEEPEAQPIVLANHFEGKRLNSPNDAVVTTSGAIIFTDPTYGLRLKNDSSEASEIEQAVYMLTPSQVKAAKRDGRPQNPYRLRFGTEIERPNGVAIDATNNKMYVSNCKCKNNFWLVCPIPDIPTGDAGSEVTVSGCKVFAKAVPHPAAGTQGNADGLKVDARGNVWATGPGGIHVFNSKGRRIAVLATGEKTGNLAFGAEGKVYVTADDKLLAFDTKLAA